MAISASGISHHLPAALGLLALLGCSLNLSYQATNLGRLLRDPIESHPVTAALSPRPLDRQQLALLFPSAPAAHTGPAPTTSLQLTLLAVFSHPDRLRSSAIIAQPGRPAQRVTVGGLISPGIRLHSVDRQFVTLERHGQQESLHFPEKAIKPLLQASDAPPQAMPGTELAGR